MKVAVVVLALVATAWVPLARAGVVLVDKQSPEREERRRPEHSDQSLRPEKPREQKRRWRAGRHRHHRRQHPSPMPAPPG